MEKTVLFHQRMMLNVSFLSHGLSFENRPHFKSRIKFSWAVNAIVVTNDIQV